MIMTPIDPTKVIRALITYLLLFDAFFPNLSTTIDTALVTLVLFVT